MLFDIQRELLDSFFDPLPNSSTKLKGSMSLANIFVLRAIVCSMVTLSIFIRWQCFRLLWPSSGHKFIKRSFNPAPAALMSVDKLALTCFARLPSNLLLLLTKFNTDLSDGCGSLCMLLLFVQSQVNSSRHSALKCYIGLMWKWVELNVPKSRENTSSHINIRHR